ncbi:hypothetical protein V1478_009081 [Vespula squamosa]|uniref:Uncharacterized protein n=1 Tax=Vespula squamosa TaxID=30214 RepID=A0ABD2ANM5_VESSQ
MKNAMWPTFYHKRSTDEELRQEYATEYGQIYLAIDSESPEKRRTSIMKIPEKCFPGRYHYIFVNALMHVLNISIGRKCT